MVFFLLTLALTQIQSQSSSPQAPPAPVRDARPTPVGTGVIRGRVVADDTGEPVRGVRVMLMKGSQPFGPERDAHPQMTEPNIARTNEEGRYGFTRLPPGTYRVMAVPEMSNPRYLSPIQFGAAMPFGKPIELADGQKVQAPDIRLPRGGVLAGRVLDELGEPLAYVRVNSLRRIGGGEPRQVGGSMNGTDDLGRFRLFGLAAGEYYLVAEPQNFAPPTETVRHLSTYYPSALTLAEATPIRLKAGEEIGDLEIRLASGRTFTVSGSIITSKGEPFSVRHGQASFNERTAGGGMSGRGVELKEDGTFVVRGVKPGTYSIEVQPQMRFPNDDVPLEAEFASTPVTVSDGDVEGVTIVTQVGASVTGEVIFDTPPAESSYPLHVMAMPASGRTMMFPPGRAQVAPDGTFKLSGLFRPVFIRVFPPPGHHLASVALDGQDITDTPIDFKPGKTGKLLISLSSRLSALSGQVRAAQGKPAAASVFAFGEDRSLWSPHATTTKSVSADEEKGAYRITGLRPGRYLVVAVPLGSRPPMMFDEGAEAWEALARHASVVTVGVQEQATLDLTLVSERDR
jgi:protocatechuate 3,4-dioxygenase beta subunit